MSNTPVLTYIKTFDTDIVEFKHDNYIKVDSKFLTYPSLFRVYDKTEYFRYENNPLFRLVSKGDENTIEFCELRSTLHESSKHQRLVRQEYIREFYYDVTNRDEYHKILLRFSCYRYQTGDILPEDEKWECLEIHQESFHDQPNQLSFELTKEFKENLIQQTKESFSVDLISL